MTGRIPLPGRSNYFIGSASSAWLTDIPHFRGAGVVDLYPGVELRWIGRMLVPGLFDGEHYFRLSPSAAGTQLLHGEVFRGILIPFFRKDLETKVRAGFEQMNRALKDRAEAG